MGEKLKIIPLSISLKTYNYITIHNNSIPLKWTKVKPTISLSAGGIYYQKDVGVFLLVEGVLKSRIRDNENLVVFFDLGTIDKPKFYSILKNKKYLDAILDFSYILVDKVGNIELLKN